MNFRIEQECALCRLYAWMSGASRSRAQLASILLVALVVLAQPVSYLAFSISHVLRNVSKRERRKDTSQASEQQEESWGSEEAVFRIAALTRATQRDARTAGRRLDYPFYLQAKVRDIERAKQGHRFSSDNNRKSLIDFSKHRYNLETMFIILIMLPAVPFLRLMAHVWRDTKSIFFLSSEGHVVAPTRVRCYQFCEQINDGCQTMSCDVLAFYDHYLENKGFLVSPSHFPAGRLSWKLLRHLLVSKHGVIVHQRPDYDFLVTLIAKWILGRRIKLVVDIDDFTFPQKSQLVLFKLFYVANFVDILAPWADTFVLSSRHLLHYVQRRYPYHEPYLLPTFPGRRFLSTTERSEDANRSGSVVFTWVGTLYHPENLLDVLFILRAWLVVDLEDAELHIVGGGLYHSLLKLVLEGLEESNNLKIKDWIPPDQMPDYLSDVDVGLYCLTNDSDFMRSKSPTKLFEYWAHGKAVVSTSLGEAGYYVTDNENGLIADTCEEMARAFRQLAQDPYLRFRLGTEGQRQVREHWNQEAVCRCYGEILERESPRASGNGFLSNGK